MICLLELGKLHFIVMGAARKLHLRIIIIYREDYLKFLHQRFL